MENIDCSAVCFDPRVKSERWVRRAEFSGPSSDPLVLAGEPEAFASDLFLLLEICKEIYLCHSHTSLAMQLAALAESHINDYSPVFAFYTLDSDDTHHVTLQLLSSVSADIQVQDAPNLVIPVAVVRSSMPIHPVGLPSDTRVVAKCLDAGAIDVLATPLEKPRVHGLTVHAYRTRKAAQQKLSLSSAKRKSRKQSWLGLDDEKPYAYLREAMVSKLTRGICSPEDVIGDFQVHNLDVSTERANYVMDQLPNWAFAAHEFTEDELSFAACEMLRHGFDVPGLEQWRLAPDELHTFLLACRSAYNSFVLYHNFRHAIDVLQSIFCCLLHIGALPQYRSFEPPAVKSPIASLLTPFDSLTLLISAIGHDVGHPGVNNVFLVKLNAPLAQLYNDSSVLEAFHCAAFSQILRRHWPAAFKEKHLRKLLISSILATDMGIHQTFMDRMASLQNKFHENSQNVVGWSPQDIDTYKTLLCGLLIKCADISNVARPWDVAEEWTRILQEEFANQGEMEREVGLETALFGGPPEIGNVYKLATGQIGFMSIFALPLFEGVSDLLPQLTFTVDQIRTNHRTWQQVAEREKAKQAECLEELMSPQSSNLVPGLEDADRTTQGGTARDESLNSNNANADKDPLIDLEMPSRKSSSAVPADIAMAGIAEAPREEDVSAGTEHHAYTSANVNSAIESTSDPTDSASENASGGSHRENPGQECHYANDNSFGIPSCPSSGRQSCTRIHSVSTRSNTVMSPVSPATNATSFLTVDSGDDMGSLGDGIIANNDRLRNNKNGGDLLSRSGSIDHDVISGKENDIFYHPGGQCAHNMDKNAVMTTILGREEVSPSQPTAIVEKVENEGQNENDNPDDRDGMPRPRLPKRRSRLRLAFWKRKSYFQHRQEMRNET